MAKSADPWGPQRRRGPVAWWRDHWRTGGESLNHLSGRVGTSFLVWLLIGIALALPGGLYLLQINLGALTADWEGKPGLSVYLQLGAGPEVGEALLEQLAADERVERAWLITADEALEEFQAFTGLADALTALDSNPLPGSIRVVLADEVSVADLDLLASRLTREDGVDEVSIEKTWLERLDAASSAVTRLGWGLAALFALGAVLVTATSVRLAIETRLDELRVMKLVGATDAYIRRPFLYFGLLYGLGGGLVGAMLISIVLVLVETPLVTLVGSDGKSLEVHGFNVGFVAGLLVVGGVLGVCGALLAAHQRLDGLEVV
jgi:cell division transport system permease protein